MSITASEAGKLLGIARMVDNRQFDEATAIIWSQTIDRDVSFNEAMAAVQRHISTSSDWMLPSHINKLAKAMRAERTALIRAAGAPDFPGGLSWEEERNYRRRYNELVGDGLSREEAHTQTDSEHGVTRPELAFRPDIVSRAIEEFANRPEPTASWGPWSLTEDGTALLHEGGPWGIELDQFRTLEQLATWTEHISGKGWGKPNVRNALARAFRALNREESS